MWAMCHCVNGEGCGENVVSTLRLEETANREDRRQLHAVRVSSLLDSRDCASMSTAFNTVSLN